MASADISIDRRTGEEIDDNVPRDEYGRPWGSRLWPNGPILGGPNWREFVAAKAKFRADVKRGEWEK
jgi:hypothetical protein